MSAFARSAHSWAKAGWGALPLPAGKKFPPPQGWTGRGAPYPSGADIQAWIEEEPDANLGLRFPQGVVGLDVDDYTTPEGVAKHGLATLVECTKKWGKLPSAPRITSRPGTKSGIYLYRLPDGISSDRFMGELPGGNVEILRPEHRYAVGPGSVHPDTGQRYLLLLPPSTLGAGISQNVNPPQAHVGAMRREDLPLLPKAWIEGLTLNEKHAASHDVVLAGGRGNAYTKAAVERVIAELHDIADWPDGKVDGKGRGWEKIQADAAYRLASLALAEWNTLTLSQAQAAFGSAAPVGGGWTGADVAGKWRSQVRRAEPADPPKTQDTDPLGAGFDWSRFAANFEGVVSDERVGLVGTGNDDLPGDSDPADSTMATSQTAQEWVKHSWDDKGNAERVVRLLGPRLRYLPPTDRWMEYDAEHGRWEESRLAGARAVMRMIDQLPKLEGHLYSTKMYPKGAKGETSDYLEFIDWVASQRFDSRYRAAANVLKSTGLLDDAPASFDAHPLLLNCQNGIIDLRTGELLPHDPIHRLRRQIPVNYDPKAKAPEFRAYIRNAHPDVDVADYLQRITGYSLTGSTKEQVFFIHQGPPNTGKSLYLNVMTALLGDLARVVPSTTLMAKKNDAHPTEIMGLAGRRMLTASESAEGARLDAALVKRLSGSDFITARGMGQDFQDFRLVGKIHLVTNHLPHIPDDAALQRRIHVVPWRVIVPPEKVDDDLEERIVTRELPGILAWAVEGALAWRAQKLDRPPAAHLATLDYFEEEDEFGLFLTEMLVPTKVTWTSSKALFQYYLRWCDSNRVRPMSKVAFGRKMSARKFEMVKSGSDRGYRCTLKADPINADPLAP